MIFRFAGTALGNAGLAQAEALRCNMPGRRRKLSRLSKSALFLVVMLAISAGAGSPPSDSSGGQQILDDSSPLSDATILIIRHAEKPGSGSGLSVEGAARARTYVRYFQNFRIDSQPLRLDYLVAADDSEHSQRSRLTLEPLAEAIGLKPDLRFQASQPRMLARELQSRAHGKAILICWHHKGIPELLEALGANPERLLPHGEWPGEQFGWVLQLQFDGRGHLIRGKSKRIKEHLMPED
jgi:hypothetical protein